MAGNRIQVYLHGQDPASEVTRHHSSLILALQLVAARTAQWFDLARKKLVLLTSETWAQVKLRFRGSTTLVQKLYPPREPENMMLSYPPVARGADERRRQAELWMSATKF